MLAPINCTYKIILVPGCKHIELVCWLALRVHLKYPLKCSFWHFSIYFICHPQGLQGCITFSHYIFVYYSLIHIVRGNCASVILIHLFLYCTGGLNSRFPVLFSEKQSTPQPCDWSATIYPGNMHTQSVTIHICSPVMSSVALYRLLVHIESRQHKISYLLGTFVLLCNPWLKGGSMKQYDFLLLSTVYHPGHDSSYHCFSGDPVYMPLDVHKEEYIKSDYGLIYMGTTLNVSKRPWSFGQVCDIQKQRRILGGLYVIAALIAGKELRFCLRVCSMSLESWKHVWSSLSSAHHTSVTKTKIICYEETQSTSAGWSVLWWATISHCKHVYLLACPLIPSYNCY